MLLLFFCYLVKFPVLAAAPDNSIILSILFSYHFYILYSFFTPMSILSYFLFPSILIFYILLFFYINEKQYNPRVQGVSNLSLFIPYHAFLWAIASVLCVCFVCNKPPYVITYIRYNYVFSLIYLSSLQLQTTLYLTIRSLLPSLFLISILHYTPLLYFFLLYAYYSFF